MKKITALFFLFLICLVFSKKGENISPAFQEFSDFSSTSLCSITFQNKDINTKNFENYFAQETILSVQPYIREIYQDKMQKVKIYTFTPDTQQNNLSLLERLYKENLRDNGIMEDTAKVEIYGVPIKEVLLLCNSSNFSYLKNLSYEIKVKNM